LERVGPQHILDALATGGYIFTRGLPVNEDLRDTATALIFSDVLRDGSIVQSDSIDKGALDKCFRNGWLHADTHRGIHGVDIKVYAFPSRLHRWFVDWKLGDFDTPQPQLDNIFHFAIAVINRFSPRHLSGERRIGPGCIQLPPEAQYQDEFYRSCYACWKGSIKAFPEFGTKNGRVDFFIPSKRWGVELLREGDRLAQHSGRFARSGAYEVFSLDDYIILDCRTSWPRKQHSMCIVRQSMHFLFFSLTLHTDIQKLYHVVFSDDYRFVDILDNMLNSVHRAVLLNN